jgi:uncharacterized protein YfdQ (DUF2303 family)
MATLCPSTSDILANYTSFYNWLQSPSRSSCTNVTNSDVYDALRVARGNPGTTIAQLNSEIKAKKAELENTRAQADITKRRAEMNVRPELTANSYEARIRYCARCRLRVFVDDNSLPPAKCFWYSIRVRIYGSGTQK